MVNYFLIFLLSSTGVASGDVVVKHQSFSFEELSKEARKWRKPDFSRSEKTLGYTKESFEPPKGLEENVDFWFRIYSEVSTSEGLLHDSVYPHLVYEKVDFGPILNDETLSDREKRRAKKKLVKDKKKEIKANLLALEKVKDPSKLEGEQKRLWEMFERVDERNKFRQATQKSRLRFQLGQSDRFRDGIFYSGRYIEKMEEIFLEEGLPLELTRLPYVESSFNLAARSKVGASGIWQFMRSTGKQYMNVTSLVDERNDPITATRSAAKLLKYNYDKLQNWPLAVTAYNYGPSGLRRLVRKHKTNDLVEIIKVNRSRRFGFASSNFFASYLAALRVEKEADKHFKDLKMAKALEYEEVVLIKPISFEYLSSFFPDSTTAEFYNPHLGRQVIKGYFSVPRKTRVRLIPGKMETFIAGLEKESKSVHNNLSRYKVARGDTLSHIAQDFGVTIHSIKEANNIQNARRIRAGQILLIPKPSR